MRIILGPTASGKESTAVLLAEKLDADIVSVDSMKIYNGMDIGTATPSADTLKMIKHWAVNIVEPYESFSIAQYLNYTDDVMKELSGIGRNFIFSGGTALYHKILTEGMFSGPGENKELREKLNNEIKENGAESVHVRLKELDPAAAEKIHPNDTKRLIRALEVIEETGVPISAHQIQFGKKRTDRIISMVGLMWDREKLYERINKRVDIMLDKGLQAEAEAIFNSGKKPGKQAAAAVGYAEFFKYFAGQISFDEAVELIKRNSRHLAKSQMTWYRKFDCTWIDVDENTTPEELADKTEKIWTENI
jgi:tRNA dimethylallyltransferase